MLKFGNTFVNVGGTYLTGYKSPTRTITIIPSNGGVIAASPNEGNDGDLVTLSNTAVNNYMWNGYSLTGGTLTGSQFSIQGNASAQGVFTYTGSYVNANAQFNAVWVKNSNRNETCEISLRNFYTTLNPLSGYTTDSNGWVWLTQEEIDSCKSSSGLTKTLTVPSNSNGWYALGFTNRKSTHSEHFIASGEIKYNYTDTGEHYIENVFFDESTFEEVSTVRYPSYGNIQNNVWTTFRLEL